MPLSRFLRDRLNEIATGEMPPLTRAQRKRGFQYGPWQRFHADEDGKISFVSVFTVLIMLIFILLVANAGIAVKEKIELQNAADSTAYSSALWQARSLNAITTTNHLMGELTAITVILDSFGGEMLGQASLSTDESRNYNDRLGNLRDAWAHDKAEQTITAQTLGRLDKQVVATVIDLLTDDNGTHDAGAAIYDAKLTLKFTAFLSLFIKDKTNLLLDAASVLYKSVILSWAAPICEAIAAPIHVVLSKYLVDVGIEWAYLEATESVVGLVNSNGVIRNGIREAILPALSLYADTVVGSKVAKTVGSGAPFNESVRKSQEFLKAAHRLKTAETMPSWEKMKLPVVAEEPPSSEESQEKETKKRMGVWDYPKSQWTGDFTSWEIKKIRGPYEDIKREMNNLMGELGAVMGPISDAADAVEDGLDSLGIGGVASISPQMQQALDIFKQVKELIDELREPFPESPPKHPNCFKENPCINDRLEEDLRLSKFYWEVEPKSQWVRATYPYVDEYRAPIIKFFKSNCRLSDAATYYAHWTNRYTLSNSWEIRKDNDKKESADESKKKNLFAKLKAEVSKLRDRFEKATDDTEEENAGTVNTGKFDSISRDLNELVNSKLKSEIESLQVKVPWVKDWLAKVREHKRLSESLGKSVTPSADLGLEPKAAQGIAEEMAIINLLDELLTILEDFLDAFEFGSPHMYVLKGMEPGSKGIGEPWIENNDLADELFVVTAVVSRPSPTLMGAIFDKNTPKEDRYAIASAMVYNANGRNMTSQQSNFQPNTGWDTLNWAPPVRAGEWGNHKPSDSSNRLPWQLTTPNRLTEPNQVKLNWQVKLVPMTGKGIKALSDKGLSMWAKEHAATIHH